MNALYNSNLIASVLLLFYFKSSTINYSYSNGRTTVYDFVDFVECISFRAPSIKTPQHVVYGGGFVKKPTTLALKEDRVVFQGDLIGLISD